MTLSRGRSPGDLLTLRPARTVGFSRSMIHARDPTMIQYVVASALNTANVMPTSVIATMAGTQ
jgi:hypothetical protein